MNNESQNQQEKIVLSAQEREQMRRTVHAYIAMKPIRSPVQHTRTILSFGWLLSPRWIAGALVAALFVSSAGISYAAQNALPGDPLYPVKVDINEPVSGALAISPSAKEQWAMDVAGERLKEAATLAAEGRLSTSTQQELQSNFDAHAQVAIDAIAQEASSSPETGAETAVRFSAQLDEYQHILAQVGAATTTSTGSLAASIAIKQQRIDAIRAHVEEALASASSTSSGTDIAAASQTRDDAEQQLDASLDLSHTVSGALASSSAQSVAIQLQSASTAITQGEHLLGADSVHDALGAFQNALAAGEQLGVFLQTSDAINQHTGLVIGEPQATSTPDHRTAENKHSTAAASFKPAAVSSVNASSTASASTTEETQTGSMQATSTSATDTGANTATNGETPQTTSNILPISVPTTILP